MTLEYNLDEIKSDLMDENNPSERQIVEVTANLDEIAKNEEDMVRSIPSTLWKKIEQWGKESGLLHINQQSFAGFDIANAVRFNRAISESNRKRAMNIYEIVCENNIELLAEADELTEQEKAEQAAKAETAATTNYGITIELLQKMVDWDKRRRILKDWQWNVMNDIVSGKKPLNDRLAWGCKQNLKTLKQHGFTEE